MWVVFKLEGWYYLFKYCVDFVFLWFGVFKGIKGEGCLLLRIISMIVVVECGIYF